MVILKISAGTRIYLTKKKPYDFYMLPDRILENDILHVAYDVRVNGSTVIPKGTRVSGNWVTESNPTIAAQLQITRIYLHNIEGEPLYADSSVIEMVTRYNTYEIGDTSHLYTIKKYRSTSNIDRRIASFNNRVRALRDSGNKLNSLFVEISTKEIPVTLTVDFTSAPCIESDDVYMEENGGDDILTDEDM
jgi:hypothetical protein